MISIKRTVPEIIEDIKEISRKEGTYLEKQHDLDCLFQELIDLDREKTEYIQSLEIEVSYEL